MNFRQVIVAKELCSDSKDLFWDSCVSGKMAK
jgi:hypothetical protein